jgi:cyclopropane fatty-acyl-phospholipid synthase-like methyltransferase
MTRRLSVGFVAVAFLMLAGASSIAQQRSPQQQRTPEEYAKFLEGAERVARMQIPRVVDALNLKPGVKVADIGAGSGLFTRPIAARIAPTPVYAVEIDAPLLTILERSAKEAGLTNVRPVLAAADDPKLPEAVDLILVCDALHHIANQGAYLKTLRKYLTPGGRLAIIDFRDNWPEGHDAMRFSPAQLEAWTKAAGFTPLTSYDWIQDSFFVIYR